MFERTVIAINDAESDRPLVNTTLSLVSEGSLRLLGHAELASLEPSVTHPRGLTRVAVRWGADLLAVSAPAPAVREAAPGDLARAIAQHAPLPLLVAGEHAVGAVRPPLTIGVPVASIGATAALHAAAKLAARDQAGLEVLGYVAEGTRPSKQLTDAHLDEITASLPVAVNARFVRDDPLGSIVELAQNVDLVVCGTSPRPSTKRRPQLYDRLISDDALPALLIPAAWPSTRPPDSRTLGRRFR